LLEEIVAAKSNTRTWTNLVGLARSVVSCRVVSFRALRTTRSPQLRCYAKSADPARIEFCGEALNPLFHAGAHCALGASYYTFIKEIPIGSEYVMESRAGGWGDKW
jgi:hypothetical protein